jgi:hypothetical protein
MKKARDREQNSLSRKQKMFSQVWKCTVEKQEADGFLTEARG